MQAILAVALAISLSGCSLATRAGVAVLYRKADLPASQIVPDICYTAASPCDTPRHTLDLYQPAAKGWPVIIFVHGGNWDSGDKNYRAGGADVYANIGRFYAARGIGVAVINYRLQPAVAWPAQVEDVHAAVAWVQANIQQHGGRPDRVFLMGHSAGAHLASMVALTTSTIGLTTDARVQGVIAVSGAALDLTDQQTYQLGADRIFYRQRFQGGDRGDLWQQRASPAAFANRAAPAFLILYATGETRALQRQSQVLHDALSRTGASSRLVPVPGESHTRMVLALTHPEKPPVKVILDFVRATK